jgi:hypothetical protein
MKKLIPFTVSLGDTSMYAVEFMGKSYEIAPDQTEINIDGVIFAIDEKELKRLTGPEPVQLEPDLTVEREKAPKKKKSSKKAK